MSGADKLLERATRLGLLVEISRRGTWRSYVTPDIAVSLGLVAPMRGRPRLMPSPLTRRILFWRRLMPNWPVRSA